MNNKIDCRYAIGKKEANAYDTNELREAFLAESLMTPGKVVWIYTHYERFMLGSAVPTTTPLFYSRHFPRLALVSRSLLRNCRETLARKVSCPLL